MEEKSRKEQNWVKEEKSTDTQTTWAKWTRGKVKKPSFIYINLRENSTGWEKGFLIMYSLVKKIICKDNISKTTVVLITNKNKF